MMSGIQSQNGCCSFSNEHCSSTVYRVASSVVSKVNSVAQYSLEYTAAVLTNWGRGIDYTTQWISEYSNCSSRVKQTSGRVKEVADRFNLFGAFCEMVSSGKSLIAKPMGNFGDVIDSVGAYVGSTADFTGRLAGFKIISLGAAKPFIEGVGAIADSAIGLNGIKDSLRSSELKKSLVSAMINMAKNVALVVGAVLSGVASCFTAVLAGSPQIPLYVLIAGTTYLALKIVDCFYDKLVLSPAFDSLSRV